MAEILHGGRAPRDLHDGPPRLHRAFFVSLSEAGKTRGYFGASEAVHPCYRTSLGRTCLKCRGANAYLRQPTCGRLGLPSPGLLLCSSPHAERLRLSHRRCARPDGWYRASRRDEKSKQGSKTQGSVPGHVTITSRIYTPKQINVTSKRGRLIPPYPNNTVGLVVEYTPATGETRVRFSDGVPSSTKRRASQLCKVLFLPF